MVNALHQLPKHDTLFWPVVNALQNLGGAADNDQIVEKVCEVLILSDELTAIPHGSGPLSEIAYRIAWVKTWLKWGAILDNPQRGVWALTELGRQATISSIEEIRVRLRAKPKLRGKATAEPEHDLNTPQDAEAFEEAEELVDASWQNELLTVIKKMEPAAFERLARLLLLRLGFSQVEVVGRSGDGGIDLLGAVKLNHVLSFRVIAQCKRYQDTVGPGDLRNFRGAMQGRTDKGIFITSGRFTGEARKEASRDGVPEIDLVDGEALTQLLKEFSMGVETKMVEKVSVDGTFFLKV